jgi:hypothetical protein
VNESAKAVISLTKQELIEYCQNLLTHAVMSMCESGAFNPGVLCRWCNKRMSIVAYRTHQPRCEMNPKVIAHRERLARIAKYSAKPLS